jgi:CRP/FNR family transcriptional regulator
MEDLYTKFVSGFPFLAVLSSEEKDIVKANITYYKFSEQQLLLTGADKCNRVYFVLAGTLRVFKLSEEGREVTLYRLGQGDICLFTLSCLVGIGELNTSVEADGHAEVISLPGAIFQKLLKSNPKINQHIMETVFLRLNQLMQVVEMVTFVPIKKRVALFLCQALEKQNSLKLRLTKERIAFEIGTAREVVSRILGEFEREGVLILSRGTVIINDEILLKNLCAM